MWDLPFYKRGKMRYNTKDRHAKRERPPSAAMETMQ